MALQTVVYYRLGSMYKQKSKIPSQNRKSTTIYINIYYNCRIRAENTYGCPRNILGEPYYVCYIATATMMILRWLTLEHENNMAS